MPYICLHCGELFDDPVEIKEWHGEVQPGCWEVVSRESPCCGDGFVKAYECPNCHDLVRPPEIGKLCDRCGLGAVELLREYLLHAFSYRELEYLDAVLDGRSLEDLVYA